MFPVIHYSIISFQRLVNMEKKTNFEKKLKVSFQYISVVSSPGNDLSVATKPELTQNQWFLVLFSATTTLTIVRFTNTLDH